MFRYAVKGENYVTVEEELSHIQEYALIIYYRFMGRITIIIDAQPDTGSYYIPRLILQPIVENAVFHGLEKQIGPGRIEVAVFIENGFIHMKVTDNGLGMDARTVEKVIRSLEIPSENNSIGLSNIAHRLWLFYSNKSNIKISSILGTGTNVELILPANKEVLEDVPSNYCG